MQFIFHKNGRIYALSPFKVERTASMLCTEQDARFHCFTSGECGDKVWLVAKLLDRPMSDPVVLNYFNYKRTSLAIMPNQGKFNFTSDRSYSEYPF